MSFFAELKRRNVVRVGIAYIVIGWFLAQLAEFAFENFGAPDWVLKTFVAVLLLGLPLALFFAWAFELTPEGIKREKDVDRSQSITPLTGRKLDFVIIGALVLALGYFIWERQASVDSVDSVKSSGEATIAAGGAVMDSGPAVRSIAVLPFVNMSSDKEQDWFSDGLTEEILNALARTPDLLVAARTSSFKFKGSGEDIPTIAKALGVAHVLEGSVRQARDRLRVTAQLIRASDGFHLWSQTYDRDPEDVISIQEDVAIEIATALDTAIDPEALEKMVSSGTNSVEAYNAYLKGQAYDASTLSTGDAYVFLSARDSFERAVELDPGFAFAYWELANFWSGQLQTTNIVSGIVKMPVDEMQGRFDDAINKAIEYETDPINKIRFRVLRDSQHLRLVEASRLNTEYLEQRPNDQAAQSLQLSLLADLQRDDELRAAITEFQGRDGYDVLVSNNSMTMSLISDDPEFIRQIAKVATQRIGDSAFVVYQAHRSLLWAGDVDGASQLVSILQSSGLPEDSRLLVGLRQACAENRLSDAAQIYDRLVADYPDDTSIVWIGHRIMNQDEKAVATLMELDQNDDLRSLRNFLSYAYFDASPFPNLMALLESQGVEPREPRVIPYRCKQ
jgi:TolB-like protein